jgi:hypothetical protein
VAFAELDAELSKPRWPLMLEDVSRIEPPISATYAPGRDNRTAIECVMVASNRTRWNAPLDHDIRDKRFNPEG